MTDPDVDAAPPIDTGIRPMPPFDAADERTLLTGMLDGYREGVRRKVEGVSAAHASAAPLPSATSINGLLKHLALVEDWWFTVRFAGQPPPRPWAGSTARRESDRRRSGRPGRAPLPEPGEHLPPGERPA